MTDEKVAVALGYKPIMYAGCLHIDIQHLPPSNLGPEGYYNREPIPAFTTDLDAITKEIRKLKRVWGFSFDGKEYTAHIAGGGIYNAKTEALALCGAVVSLYLFQREVATHG